MANFFDEINKGTEALKAFDQQMLKTLSVLEKIEQSVGASNSIKELTKATQDFQKEQKNASTIQSERLKIEKQLVISTNKLAVVQSDQNKKLQANKIATQEANKSIRDNIKAGQAQKQNIDRLIGSVDRLTASRNELKSQNKELIKTRDSLTRGTEEGRRGIEKINKRLDENNKILKENDSALGKQKRGIGAYTIAILKATGIIQLASQAVNFLKNSFNQIIDTNILYEKANASLAGVLGKTREETQQLQAASQELGRTTVFSATQVTKFQTELAKLGFTEREILQSTSEFLNGAIALGATLEDTATLVGSSLRAFGRPVKDTGKFVDLLSKATQTTALDFEKLQAVLRNSAPAANAAGVSIERLVSLAGILSNANIDARRSGTALKNVFITLEKEGLNLDDALEEVNSSTLQLATAERIFGKEAAVAIVTLAANREEADKLEKSYQNLGGTARRVAQENLKASDIESFESALAGLFITLNSISDGFRSVVRSATDFLLKLQGVNVEVRKAEQAFEKENQTLKDQNKIIDQSLSTYENLINKSDKTTEEQIKLKEATDEISRAFPAAVTEVDAYGKALRINVRDVKLASEVQRAYVLTLQSEAVEKYRKSITELSSDFEENTEKQKTILRQTRELNDLLASGETVIVKTNISLSKRGTIIETIVKTPIADTLREFNEILVKQNAVVDENSRSILGNIEGLRRLGLSFEDIKTIVGDSIPVLNELIEAEKASFEASEKASKEAEEASEKASEARRKARKGAIDEIKTKKETAATDKKTAKETAEAVKKRAEDFVVASKVIVAQAEKEKTDLANKFLDGLITAEEFQKRRVDVNFDANERILEGTIQLLQAQLEIEKLTADEKLKINEDLEKALAGLRNSRVEEALDSANTVSEGEKQEVSDRMETFRLGVEIARNASQTLFTFAQAGLNARRQVIDEELNALRAREQAGEELNEMELARVKELQVEKAKIAQEEFLFNQAQALVNIAINTAVAVSKALPNIPLSIVVGGLGAAQAVLVLSQKPPAIPSFAEGTESAPKGMALVGEEGRELVVPKHGKPWITPNKASLAMLSGGEHIFTKEETDMLFLQRPIDVDSINVINNNDNLEREVRGMNKYLKRNLNRPMVNNIIVNQTGGEMY